MAHPATPVTEDAAAPDRRAAISTLVLGLLMVAGGVLVVLDALSLPDTSAVVGPAAVPLPVGVLLAAIGAVLAVRALPGARSRTDAADDRQAARPGWTKVAVLAAAVVAFAVLLPLLGYVVCATALFTAAALLLGAPRDWRVPAYGWALAAIVFLVFDRLIGLTLPGGPWGF